MARGPNLTLERACLQPVCGVDEAGRGPWAGPVSAAAVILKPGTRLKGLDDSKKLSFAERDRLEAEIKRKASRFLRMVIQARPAWKPSSTSFSHRARASYSGTPQSVS